MGTFTVEFPSGKIWTPQFISAIDPESCIGCGRCFKACSHDVLALVGVSADGNNVAVDDDDEDDEYDKKIMILAHKENCIGCEACSMMCTKKCISYEAAQV